MSKTLGDGCNGPNITLVIIKIMTCAGFVLSVLTLTGCKYFSRTCTTVADGTNVACTILGDQTYFGFYTSDISTASLDVDVPNGACLAYTNSLGDMKFRVAQISGSIGASFGALGALIMFSVGVCLFGILPLILSGTVLFIGCLFQSLTLLVLDSAFCNIDSNGMKVSCKLDRTAWLSIAGAASYLVAFVASFALIPSVKRRQKRASNRQGEGDDDLYALDTQTFDDSSPYKDEP